MATPEIAAQQVEFPTHQRPHTETPVATMIGIAVAFTVLWFLVLSQTPISPRNFVRDLFLGAKVENGVVKESFLIERLIFQGAITFVWALSTATIFLKMMRINQERATLEADTVPEDLDFTDREQCVAVYERVKAKPSVATSVGLTRVARVLAMWINTGDFERTQQYAREQSDLDAAASDASFRRNRLFIWAMPLLGFVGTVYGVAAGISGFASFLSSGNVTQQKITEQVGMITTGLAVAFYCTLLGLLTAGLAAFPSLMAERREEDTLEEIEEYVEDRMLSRMPSVGEMESSKFPFEEMVSAIRQGLESVQTQTKFPIEELAQAIDAGFRRLPNPDRYEEVFTRAITKASDLINQKYDEFAQNYERRVGELGSQLGGKLEGVGTQFNAGTQRLAQQLNEQSQRLAQTLTEMESRQAERAEAVVEEMKRLAQQMPEEFRKAQERSAELQNKAEQKTIERNEELTEQITTLGKEQAEQFGEAHERYLEAIADLDRKEISRWEKMVGDFNQLATRLAESFKQAVTALDSASGRYTERLQASVQALNEQLEKVGELGVEIDKVLRTTQSMEAAMRQVGSSDEFRQTLANLRSHLSTSDELLKQLSRPRKVVFQEARGDDAL